MALRMVWCIFSCCFHFFCCVLGRNPPWVLTLLGSGGVGFVIQVCSMHWLRELMIVLECSLCVFPLCMGEVILLKNFCEVFYC